MNKLNSINNNINNLNNMNMTTVSYLTDAEVEKIKQEANTLKSNNIIFREDINRLTDVNNHLENELIEQRKINIEITSEKEQISQEKSKLELAQRKPRKLLPRIKWVKKI